MGPVEANPEYQLIVQANNLSVEIENEISEYTCTLFLLYCIIIQSALLFKEHIYSCTKHWMSTLWSICETFQICNMYNICQDWIM